MNKLAYIAGALRTPDQQKILNNIAKEYLDKDFDVWLPHKDIGILSKNTIDVGILKANFDAIEKCNVAVFCLQYQSGSTWFEFGYAMALNRLKGKPKIDIRLGVELPLMVKLAVDMLNEQP